MPRSQKQFNPASVITEKQFMQQVTVLAKSLGYRVYHPWLSIRSERGWPDLSFWKPGVFFLAELKTEKGKLTESQREAIIGLRLAGVHVYVWRPRDWDDVVATLMNPPRLIAETCNACPGCSQDIE